MRMNMMNKQVRDATALVHAVKRVLVLGYGISTQEASMMIEKVGDYNINSVRDMFDIMEDELGLKKVR